MGNRTQPQQHPLAVTPSPPPLLPLPPHFLPQTLQPPTPSPVSNPPKPTNESNSCPPLSHTDSTTTRCRRLRPSHRRMPNSTYFKSLSSISNSINSRYIINLSSQTLDPPSERVLSKGLNFIPTPRPPAIESLQSDFERFSRSLRIKHFFGHKPPTPKHPFKGKSDWTPHLPPIQN